MEEIREKIALEVPTQCIPCSIQNNLVSVDCQLPCDLQLNTADKILTLLKQEGYKKQARREVARKIFAELDKECILGAGRKKRHCSGCYLVLKAKYLEEK